MSGTWRRVAHYLLWGLVVLLAVRFGLFTLDAATQQTGGFGAYYTAARVVAQDDDMSRMYEDDWFQQQIVAAGLMILDIYRPNPPTTAVLLRPLAYFDHATARAIWTLLGLIALFISIGAMLRLTGLRGLWVPAVLALVLVFQPLFANVDLAQAYGLLLGLLTLAWYGYRDGRFRLFGVLLGLVFAFKTLGAFLWGILLLERRWQAILCGLSVVVAVSLASLIWAGLDTWHAYSEQLMRAGDRPELAVTAYQTQVGFINQMLVFDSDWNPQPVTHAPRFASIFAVSSMAFVLLVSAYGAIVTPDRDLIFALAMIITIFLSPLSLDYHYTLLLLPIIILIAWVPGGSSVPVALTGLLLVAVILIAADLPYHSPRLGEGLWALLGYPKLYGGWLLWAVCLWACFASRVDRKQAETLTLRQLARVNGR